MAKKSSFWKDFKNFITRGNIIDMAVGVVIGGAFGAIVTGLVNFIINPVVAYITNGKSLDLLKYVIEKAKLDEDGVTVLTPEIAIQWGAWLQTIIDFLIVAFCIFFVLRIIMRAKNALEADKIAAAEKKAEEEKKAAEEAQKAADEAAAALAARQAELEESQLKQTVLLQEICELLKEQKEAAALAAAAKTTKTTTKTTKTTKTAKTTAK